MPRLVIAGLSGGSGKTLVSLALLLEGARRGIPVRAFKKGPDYIDAAWLTWASGKTARNLDTWMMGFTGAAESFAWHGIPAGVNVIEGNRGLYDGLDAAGTHSTAELAKTLAAPVILVVDATRVTRTAAALVLGCQRLDPAVRIAGIVINQLASARHERVPREAIESVCGIPVLGAVPRVTDRSLLPMRHLGLITPLEYGETESLVPTLIERVARHLDFDRMLALAAQAPPIPVPVIRAKDPPRGGRVTVGYLCDSAFSFYYPENLEALQAAGAELAPISAIDSAALPDHLDALYIGGGFPETHGEMLARNASFLSSIRRAAGAGLPVYAECGGLMLLSRALTWRGSRFAMAGVLPFEVEMCEKAQGHGYAELAVDTPNPFFPVGTRLRGHEFHYSRIVAVGDAPATACAVTRGVGCFPGRDAVLSGSVWASYTHLHALAAPEWAAGMVRAAARAVV